MTIYAMLKIFAVVLLTSPFLLILLGAICTFIPSGAKLLNDLFLAILGEIPIFELASNMVQVFLENKNVQFDHFVQSVLGVMFNSLADAILMSCCIFAVKTSRIFFNRKSEGRFLAAEWKLTLVGVLIGVAVIKLKSIAVPLIRSLLFPLLCILLILYGMRLMFGVPSGTYRNRRAGFLIPMLGDIILDMFTAMSAVMLVTCAMVGPSCVAGGSSFLSWLMCCSFAVALLAITSWISGAMKAFK